MRIAATACTPHQGHRKVALHPPCAVTPHSTIIRAFVFVHYSSKRANTTDTISDIIYKLSQPRKSTL